ncbi:MAG: transglycosylase SLT domain-containing protein [Spirochaetota bacterium]
MARTNSDHLIEVEDLAQSSSLGLDEVYTDPRYRALVLDFFTNQTGSEHIADLILRESERHGLPASLTFALAWTESRFDQYAVNYNHSSIDRGVFQLNNRSFPKLHEEQFFDPEINIQQGVAYLKYCLERGENQITALAMYNAGPRRVAEHGAPLVTLKYINKILSYREQLQRDFDSQLKIASLEAKLGKSVKNQANVVDRSKVTK